MVECKMAAKSESKKSAAELPREIRWFGANQRRLRQDSGQTLRAFSKEAGISYSFASSVEQGKTDFSMSYAAKIARLLNVSVENMLQRPQKSKNRPIRGSSGFA